MSILLYGLFFILVLPIGLAIGAIVSILYFWILKPIKDYKKLSPEEQKEKFPCGVFGENYH